MKKNLNTGRRKEIVNSPESFQSICLVLSLRGLVLAARPQEVAPPPRVFSRECDPFNKL